MIKINPQPEPSPIKEYGFSRHDFTAFLLSEEFLKKGETVLRWKITERDFFQFDVSE